MNDSLTPPVCAACQSEATIRFGAPKSVSVAPRSLPGCGKKVRTLAPFKTTVLPAQRGDSLEAAPLWYGVTMQEPGVSRGLSMRVPAAPDLSEASASALAQ